MKDSSFLMSLPFLQNRNTITYSDDPLGVVRITKQMIENTCEVTGKGIKKTGREGGRREGRREGRKGDIFTNMGTMSAETKTLNYWLKKQFDIQKSLGRPTTQPSTSAPHCQLGTSN